MCGIFGYLGGEHDAGHALRSMADSLRHRGPDGEGFARLPGAQLGHRRLAVIDLSETGSQPMWDHSGSLCVVFNGEIYNFQQLRNECLTRGAVFRGHSDTEVILNLYAIEGVAAFSRLDGMFAFCLVDTNNGVSYLVRDSMGVKPLYYAEGDGGIYFASELGALIRSGVVRREVDEEALRAYLRLDYVPSPLCLLRGVHKLPGGTLLKVDADGRQRVVSFGDWEPSASWQGDETEAVDEFDRLIRESVERQLVADVPVGVFLSGGIDSSIISTVAAELTEGRLHTFSIGFDEEEFDESPYFDEVAAHIGTRHHRRVVRARDVLEIVPKLPEITSEPIADGSVFPTYLLCRFARESVTVALSGDGADELFGGYPTYTFGRTADRLSRLPDSLRSMLRKGVEAMPISRGNLTPTYKAWKFVSGLDPDPIARHHRWMGTFAPEFLPALLLRAGEVEGDELERLLTDAVPAHLDGGSIERLLRTDQRFYLQDQVLVKADRASMAHSLEVRPPFLSAPVVRFARSLPARLKVRRGVGKVLLREWLGRRLPARIARRPKKGFGAPLGKWFSGELKALVGDSLSEEAVRRQGLFRPEAVRGLLEEHWTGKLDRRKEIFNLLALSLWLDFVGASRC